MMDEGLIMELEGALEEMDQFSQPRSDFALRHFVVAQHDLPARQRKQALDDLQALLYAIYDMRDKVELAEIDLSEREEEMAQATGRARRRLEIETRRLRREIWQLGLQMRGRESEARTLLGILRSMPRVTREEFEAQEGEYWRRRLTRQLYEHQMGGGGNLAAMLQVLTEPGQVTPLLDAQRQLLAQIENQMRLEAK